MAPSDFVPFPGTPRTQGLSHSSAPFWVPVEGTSRVVPFYEQARNIIHAGIVANGSKFEHLSWCRLHSLAFFFGLAVFLYFTMCNNRCLSPYLCGVLASGGHKLQ